MNDEQEIQQEAGLSDKWKVVDSAPIMMLKQPPGAGVQSGPGDYFAGPTDPTLQHDSNATRSKTAGGAIPEYSLMPTGAANAPNNAAIKSVITQSLSEITKSVSGGGSSSVFTPCTKVNYQTTEDYTVQLSDLAGIVSIGNSSGGVITLPSGSVGAAPGTVVNYGFGSGTNGATATMMNGTGNGMIATVLVSLNVVVGTVSVSDTFGNKWIPITTNSGNGFLLCTFYCAKIVGGSNTITATVPFFPPMPPPSQYPFFTWLAVYEVAGLVPNGLDQFANGVGGVGSSIHPAKASTIAFTFAQTTALTPLPAINFTPGAGWTGVTTGIPNTAWNYPAYDGGTPGGFWVGVTEYVLNPPAGVALNGTASGGVSSSADFTIANFQIAANVPATGFTSCWYCWIENTGSAPYYLESQSTIDGSTDSVLIGPNQGVMVVYDGTNWVTERGIGGSGTTLTLETNGTPNSTQSLLNIAASTGISVSESGGTVTITNTGVASVSFDTFAYPLYGTGTSAILSYNGASQINGKANGIYLWRLDVLEAYSVSKLVFDVTSGDATAGHNYDIGLYDNSGNLVANIGEQTLNTTGINIISLTQGTITLGPGTYWFAITCGAIGILQIRGSSSIAIGSFFFANSVASTPTWFKSSTVTVGTTANLPSTVTLPTITAAGNLTDSSTANSGFGATVPQFALTSK